MTRERMTAEQAATFARLVAAAVRGQGGAACRLGDLYREGLGGLRYSPNEAFRWYAKSALAEDPKGQNNLGACYEHGIGCRHSYGQAVKWYRLAVAKRIGTASMNLGYCYLNGRAVRTDKAEALRLFRQAVEWGEMKAVAEVERLEGPPRPASRARSDAEAPTPTNLGPLLDLAARDDAGERDPSVSVGADTQQAPRCCAVPAAQADQPPHPCGGVRRQAPHPCVLAFGVVPHDGPPDGTEGSLSGQHLEHQTTEIQFVDETISGTHLGFLFFGDAVEAQANPAPHARGGIRREATYPGVGLALSAQASPDDSLRTVTRHDAECEPPRTDSRRVRGGTLRGGHGAAASDTGRVALMAEDWRDRELRAYTKDDCFDMPEPGAPADESLQRVVERMQRWQAAAALDKTKRAESNDGHEFG